MIHKSYGIFATWTNPLTFWKCHTSGDNTPFTNLFDKDHTTTLLLYIFFSTNCTFVTNWHHCKFKVTYSFNWQMTWGTIIWIVLSFLSILSFQQKNITQQNILHLKNCASNFDVHCCQCLMLEVHVVTHLKSSQLWLVCPAPYVNISQGIQMLCNCQVFLIHQHKFLKIYYMILLGF